MTLSNLAKFHDSYRGSVRTRRINVTGVAFLYLYNAERNVLAMAQFCKLSTMVSTGHFSDRT